MSRKAVLVISFGTSYNDTREKTITAIENAIAENFPDRELRRAWTSRMIVAKLKKRDGEHIDNVTEAMDRLVADGFDDVIVQSTHVMNGEEYDIVSDTVSLYRDRIPHLYLGKPLLTTDDDYNSVVACIARDLVPLAGGRPLVLMGHGTEHFANATYSELQMKLYFAGYHDVFVTTVEGFPDFDNTLELMRGRGYEEVAVMPFMIVAGDHANNDMAGDEDDSLRSVLEREGYSVTCIIRGLGEMPSFRRMFIEHSGAAEEI
ncbi:MAG: sirohydrochlorin cobaltochelatase [archaeon]|nr:sirohydrochlorin cobaltochelatase [archaeon]